MLFFNNGSTTSYRVEIEIVSVCVCVSASSSVVSAGCGDYLRKCRGVAVMKRPPRKRMNTHTHTHKAQKAVFIH